MRTIDLRTDPHTPIPRPVTGDESGSAALEAVRDVIADVRRRGDAALRELTERFDGARLDTVRVPEQDIKEAAATAPQGLLDAMHEAAARIRAFAEHQRIAPWKATIGGAADGSVPAPTLAAAHVAGVTEVYRVGGAQAVAALAYGTESIPRVEVIVGPGNIY